MNNMLMAINNMKTRMALVATFCLAGVVCQAAAKEQVLVSDGVSKAVIVVPPGSMAWEGDDRRLRIWGRVLQDPKNDKEEYLKRIQRDSVNDLAYYLEKITGAPVEIVEEVSANDPRVRIYIGPVAEALYGPVDYPKPGHHGFRMIVDEKGVGLYGESAFGTSFAIYELLHQLGCRWYMPSQLGEVYPSMQEIHLAVQDIIQSPATEYRAVWNRTADPDFMRRNRLGGWSYASAHTLERYISDEQREENPDWRLHIDGQPVGRLLRWTREDVADAIADAIIAELDERYRYTMSLSPGDYVVPTEDPEEMKHDPEPRIWEPAAGRWSVSDRLYMLANRVADRVGEKYPDVFFGLLAYVNYSFPPAREPVHPNIVPVIAPIDFNRHHPMNWENHPNGFALRDMVEQWGKASNRVAYRPYGMNLAEITAPNPTITKWRTDIPIVLANNATFWSPETMGGWESMMPGYILSFRMTFDPTEDPDAILKEMWEKFYGAAAEPMEQYWHLIDRAWIEAEEFSGAGFGYLQIFTPQVMAQARELVDEALARCETIVEYQRVKMIDESLSLLELFMKLRTDFARGRFRNLENTAEDWRASVRHLRGKYADQFSFDSGLAIRYFDNHYGHSYRSANEMERNYDRLGNPIFNWKFRHNPDAEEASLAWTDPAFDDSDWPQTRVVYETWSTIGHHNSLTDEPSNRSGRMVYRATANIQNLSDDKKTFLWIGSTDGSAKVFINGQPVPYVVPEDTRHHKAGEVLDRFPSSYCRPALFDVTDFIQAGPNQISILAERTRLWEIGTGGLMSPVVFYREK